MTSCHWNSRSGHGLGLADMLISSCAARWRRMRRPPPRRALPGRHGGRAADGCGPDPPPPPAPSARSCRTLWPQAQAAAQALGVHPLGVVAQAALESNWGRSMPRSADRGEQQQPLRRQGERRLERRVRHGRHAGVPGRRTGCEYQPPSARTPTPRRSSRIMSRRCAATRAYSAALGSGTDVSAFATALQKGGYATDPHYAAKLTSVAQQVATLMGGGSAHEHRRSSLPSAADNRQYHRALGANGMADLLSTSVSGLLAFQQALDVTSNNIANASTPGYSVENANLKELPGQNTPAVTSAAASRSMASRAPTANCSRSRCAPRNRAIRA